MHYTWRWLLGIVLGFSAVSAWADANPRYTFLTEAYLRFLLLPNNQEGRTDSFVTYLQDSLTDRTASNVQYDIYDANNLLQMFVYNTTFLARDTAKVRDDVFQGYVATNFPSGKYFTYEINRAIISSSQGLLAMPTVSDLTADGTSSLNTTSSTDVDIIHFSAPTTMAAIASLMQSTPTNQYSQTNQTVIDQYNLESIIPGSDYEIVSNFLNQLSFSMSSMVACSQTFLANMALPCKVQPNATFYADVTYNGITNSSCTMQAAYIDQPWNGMGAMIQSLIALDSTMKSDRFLQTLPSSYQQSPEFQAYKNGISCLVGDLVSLYQSKGNWYNFFHWSTFTNNQDCQTLLASAGRSIDSDNNNQNLLQRVYDYLFGTGGSSSSTSQSSSGTTLSTDAMIVVNTIDGFLTSGNSQQRLSNDPTNSLLQALTSVMFRMRTRMMAQANRTVVDLTKSLSASGNSASTSGSVTLNGTSTVPSSSSNGSTANTSTSQVLPDEAYQLFYFMKNYGNSEFDPGNNCRYQGLSGQLSLTPSVESSSLFNLKQSVMLDLVGQSAFTAPLVGYQKPIPPLMQITLNQTSIPVTKQAAFLKYGQVVLSARYKLGTNGTQYEGVLNPSNPSATSTAFSVSRMVDQIQDNQRAARDQIKEARDSFSQKMNTLIMRRMMLAYIYEYVYVSSTSSWRLFNGGDQVCPLSLMEQLKISSTWRTDPQNDLLAGLLQQPSSNASGDSSSPRSSRQSVSSGASQSTSDDTSFSPQIQFEQALAEWEKVQTLRDEAFQLAKENYLTFLEYKIHELLLVFRSSVVISALQNSQAVVQGFPSLYSSNDKNQQTYVLVNTIPSSGSGPGASSDGSVDSQAVAQSTGQPNTTTQNMVNETANQGCCPVTN